MDRLVQHQQTINDQLARYGVKFGLYKNGTFQERLFPFDPLPRVITAQEFETLDRGLVQRVNALNLFLKGVYGDKKIIRDGIVLEDFVFAGSGYLPSAKGSCRRKGYTATSPASTWCRRRTAAGSFWKTTSASQVALPTR